MSAKMALRLSSGPEHRAEGSQVSRRERATGHKGGVKTGAYSGRERPRFGSCGVTTQA